MISEEIEDSQNFELSQQQNQYEQEIEQKKSQNLFQREISKVNSFKNQVERASDGSGKTVPKKYDYLNQQKKQVQDMEFNINDIKNEKKNQKDQFYYLLQQQAQFQGQLQQQMFLQNNIMMGVLQKNLGNQGNNLKQGKEYDLLETQKVNDNQLDLGFQSQIQIDMTQKAEQNYKIEQEYEQKNSIETKILKQLEEMNQNLQTQMTSQKESMAKIEKIEQFLCSDQFLKQFLGEDYKKKVATIYSLKEDIDEIKVQISQAEINGEYQHSQHFQNVQKNLEKGFKNLEKNIKKLSCKKSKGKVIM
ncbi:hypothetical protein PPERSA_11088 [Pseudocohnilembus persalinus]|uniref:Uncharacterized protein n=1 Tax=Pseudocohnilembus persalinus TaxID=266149 RepID=A0A0V0QZ05_PSEPJ|nr:hypothetical protein PPERSA_11088 [Pseudocohnilembus persalinus]|eukprot:KRX07539.1 hypothetical protein PPERSA_11088 [Pseudocohnilembus persalinus]